MKNENCSFELFFFFLSFRSSLSFCSFSVLVKKKKKKKYFPPSHHSINCCFLVSLFFLNLFSIFFSLFQSFFVFCFSVSVLWKKYLFSSNFPVVWIFFFLLTIFFFFFFFFSPNIFFFFSSLSILPFCFFLCSPHRRWT